MIKDILKYTFALVAVELCWYRIGYVEGKYGKDVFELANEKFKKMKESIKDLKKD